MSKRVKNGIVALAVVVITLLIVGTSYGVMSELGFNTKRLIAYDKTLKVTYQNNNTLDVGDEQSVVLFSVVNNGTLDLMYDVVLTPHNLEDEEIRQINIEFDGEEVKLSSLEKEDDKYIVYSGAIKRENSSNDVLSHRVLVKETKAKGSLEVRVVARAVNDLAVDVIASMSYEGNKFGLNKDINNNIRYVGVDADNYIRFNDELWRVIGIFKVKDSIDNMEALKVKIMRDMPLQESAWSNGANLFNNSTLFQVLNDSYYNQLKDNNLVDSVFYKSGEYGSITSKEQALRLEESGSTYASIVSIPTIADYLYGKEWMNGKVGWLLGSNSSTVEKFYKVLGEEIVLVNYNERALVSPVVYLNSTVRIIDGDGSRTKPFVIN